MAVKTRQVFLNRENNIFQIFVKDAQR